MPCIREREAPQWLLRAFERRLTARLLSSTASASASESFGDQAPLRAGSVLTAGEKADAHKGAGSVSAARTISGHVTGANRPTSSSRSGSAAGRSSRADLVIGKATIQK